MKTEHPRTDINAKAQSDTEIVLTPLSTPRRQGAKAQKGPPVGLASLRLCAFALILLPLCLHAATNDLSGALQKGLFEEEANRNLDAAIQAYQSVAARFDKDRQLAATAIFRLGECYRKLGKTNDAVAQYERLVREFSDQTTLVTLSRQNLAGLGATQLNSVVANSLRSAPTALDSEQVKLLGQEIKLVEQQIAEVKKSMESGKDEGNALRERQLHLLKLQRQLPENAGSVQQKKLLNDELKLVQTQLVEMKKRIEVGSEPIFADTPIQLQLLELQRQILAVPTEAGSQAATGVTDDEEKEIRRIQAMVKDSPDLINAKDVQSGATPLHFAAGNGQLKVAEFLLANGANTEAKDRAWGGRTPLHYAVSAGHKAMVELLLNHKADVQATDESGGTPLHLATQNGFKTVVDVLLARGADVNRKRPRGPTPLHLAVVNGHKSVAATLLNARADPNLVASESIAAVGGSGSYHGAPLHIAIMRGDRTMWELLLANGADVNLRDHSGRTPLRQAVENEQTETVEALLAKNADVNLPDKEGTTPLFTAVDRQNVQLVKILLDHGADPEAAGKNNQGNLSSPRVPNPGGGSYYAGNYPLRVAVQKGNLEILKLLLEHGANVNTEGKCPGVVHGPPILAALSREKTNALELLLKFKADPNVKSPVGATPLMIAVDNGSKETVDILLAAGADVKVAWQDGVTPLHMAVRDDKREIAALLLAKGADPNAKNQNGQTPLDWAKQKSPSAMPPGYPAGIPVGGVGVPSIPGRPLRLATDGVGNGQPNDIADLLRRHGALDDLPDFTSIRITRGTLKPILAFSKDADAMNRFTLLEAILNLLSRTMIVSGNSSAVPLHVFPFPDLSRIRIQRSSPAKPTERKEIVVNLLTATNSIDCTKDVPLEFGDVIEIPEREHALSDSPVALTPQQKNELEKCTARIVRFVVKGETTESPLSGAGAFLRQTLQNAEVQRILRSSSDLSRIKVKRIDSKAGKTREFIVDAQATDQANRDLWLRDGDVIEVPDKP